MLRKASELMRCPCIDHGPIDWAPNLAAAAGFRLHFLVHFKYRGIFSLLLLPWATTMRFQARSDYAVHEMSHTDVALNHQGNYD